jgi:hypothetical protein
MASRPFSKLLFVLLLGIAPRAHARFLAEGFLGTAYSLPSQVTIFQDSQPNLSFRATWSNETFKQAPYYTVRVGLWSETSGWELEQLHHKIVLNNNPSEVQAFKATFGFNMFLFSRAWDVKWLILRVGVGPVIAHPITTVRGQVYNHSVGGILGTKYHFVGAGMQLSVQRRFYLNKGFFLSAEGKLTLAFANLPVVNGTSHVPNVAVHLLGGLGYKF